MATIEQAIPRIETSVSFEREYVRKGVILVLAHQDEDGQLSVGMVEHKANPLKGIRDGDWGLPTETIEKVETDNPYTAFLRCFQEELGVADPNNLGLYFGHEDARFTHIFNLDNGQNGDASNAYGYGHVIWASDTLPVMRSFIKGYRSGLVDTTELSGFGFKDVDEILDPSSHLGLRVSPDPRRILTEVLKTGLLQHPQV